MRKNHFIDWLPPAYLPLGIKPASQACALTRSRTVTSWFIEQRSSTESHWPGNAAIFIGATAMQLTILRIWYKIQLISTRFCVLKIYVVKSIAEFWQFLWILFSLQYHILNMVRLLLYMVFFYKSL